MSDLEFIGGSSLLGLTLVALLSSFLYLKHRQRLLSQWERRNPAEWVGKGIDTSELRQTLDTVRQNYEAARPKAKGICFHRGLLGLAHQTVARLAYFHDREGSENARTYNS